MSALRASVAAATFAPMEARVADELPCGPGWQYEPKWDGFRCIAMRRGRNVELQAKSGKSLTRYFPEVVSTLASLKTGDVVLDGELAIPLGSALSFDSLQMRLHPAESRIRKLARETPAIYILFDLLAQDGEAIGGKILIERRRELEKFIRNHPADGLRLSPVTRDVRTARRWLRSGAGSLDGVIAKRTDEPYQAGERAMVKVKCLRTADCVIGGFRYAEGTRDIGSLLLGLFNAQGKLDHVGFTSGLAALAQRELKSRLKPLMNGEGFSGSAPGGPSRWSTKRSQEWEPLKPELVVEVRYDHVTADRFRHGTKFLRWRPDKAPRQCTFEQLAQEARPAKLIKDVIGRAALPFPG